MCERLAKRRSIGGLTGRWLVILSVALGGVASIGGVVAVAQSSVTVRVQWDPNPTTDAVTSYGLAVDGGTAVAVPASVCTSSLCEQSMTLSPGSHTFSVTATNQWGTSAATAVTVTITPPGPPKNVRIVK